MLRSPARYICQGTSVLAHSASRSGSTSAPPVLCASSIANLDYSQTSALLSCLIDHEKTGVPDDAGTGGQESFNLAAMHQLLSALGAPQKAWTAVHVAGTKGKGSTSAAIANILKLSQLHTGLYTSPHIASITERIQINGANIPDVDFQQLVPQHAGKMQQAVPSVTHFELLTALAFQHFKDKQVQVGVIETGLGGLKDATNVIEAENVACAVITAIDLEHLQALGGSLRSIAEAKAGIMKPRRPVVIAHQPHAEALDVLQWHARQLDCSVVRPQELVKLEPRGMEHAAEGVLQKVQAVPHGMPWFQETELKLHMLGQHQLDNAAAAIAAACVVREQGLGHISQDSIVQGLQQTKLPGRLQMLKLGSEQVKADGEGWLVLDGAHTGQSAAALATTVRQVFPDNPIALIVAMADDKDHKAVMAALRGGVRPALVIFTTVDIAGSSNRSCSPGTLAAHWQAAGLRRPRGQPMVRSRELIQASMSAALSRAHSELQAQSGAGVVVVCGSLHAVAEAQRHLGV